MHTLKMIGAPHIDHFYHPSSFREFLLQRKKKQKETKIEKRKRKELELEKEKKKRTFPLPRLGRIRPN
jgi:hypothetical protein